MSMRIFLAADTFDLFKISVSPIASCRRALDNAPVLGKLRVVECSVAEAKQLMDSAKAFCPAAVARISQAMAGKTTDAPSLH